MRRRMLSLDLAAWASSGNNIRHRKEREAKTDRVRLRGGKADAISPLQDHGITGDTIETDDEVDRQRCDPSAAGGRRGNDARVPD